MSQRELRTALFIEEELLVYSIPPGGSRRKDVLPHIAVRGAVNEVRPHSPEASYGLCGD